MKMDANEFYIIKKKRSLLRLLTETIILLLFWVYIIVDILIITCVIFKIRIPMIEGIIYYLAIDQGDARRLIHFTFIIIISCIIAAILLMIERYIQRIFFDKKYKENDII